MTTGRSRMALLTLATDTDSFRASGQVERHVISHEKRRSEQHGVVHGKASSWFTFVQYHRQLGGPRVVRVLQQFLQHRGSGECASLSHLPKEGLDRPEHRVFLAAGRTNVRFDGHTLNSRRGVHFPLIEVVAWANRFAWSVASAFIG